MCDRKLEIANNFPLLNDQCSVHVMRRKKESLDSSFASSCL